MALLRSHVLQVQPRVQRHHAHRPPRVRRARQRLQRSCISLSLSLKKRQQDSYLRKHEPIRIPSYSRKHTKTFHVRGRNAESRASSHEARLTVATAARASPTYERSGSEKGRRDSLGRKGRKDAALSRVQSRARRRVPRPTEPGDRHRVESPPRVHTLRESSSRISLSLSLSRDYISLSTRFLKCIFGKREKSKTQDINVGEAISKEAPLGLAARAASAAAESTSSKSQQSSGARAMPAETSCERCKVSSSFQERSTPFDFRKTDGRFSRVKRL